MSGLTEQFSAELEDKSVLDLVRGYYHVPLLLLAVLFSLWVRTRGWQNFVRGETVLFSGNDAWYHFRAVTYTVKHWPFVIPFDPWTGYPVGTSSGQFGTLFDQLIATAALIVGLGSPTETQIAMTHLFAPAVFGALALVPAYFLAKRVSDRNGGLVAVLLLALSTGQFLTRGVVGFADHQIAEAFFLALSAFGVATAVAVAAKEKPVYELVTARDWRALQRPVLWSVLAGLFVTFYMWTWPPGVFFLGILGIFFAIAMSVNKFRGVSPDHLAVPGITIGVVSAVLLLLTVDIVEFRATGLSLLQPLLAFGLAAGCAFLAALARLWDDREVPQAYYPVAVLGIAVAVAAVLALATPEFFNYMVDQVLRIFGYDATAETRTVAEAQPIPLQSVAGFLGASYGLAIYTALGGFAFMLYRYLIADEGRADHLFLLVLAVFLFLATLTQRRFDYYLAIPVAALNGYLAVVVFRLVDIGKAVESAEGIKAYQVMAVIAVLLFVAAPLTVGAQTAPNVAQQNANPGEVTAWTSSLDWMQENTPVEGAYGTGGEQSLEYYGTYKRTDDFEYGEGTYGVMAWWDYGHWITVLGERIPNANPFQQNARTAANALLAPDEATADDVMTFDDGESRYVVVDYQLGVAGTRKFTAPTVFETKYNLSDSDERLDNDIARTIYNPQNGQPIGTVHAPRSYESLRVRLYQFHGSAISPSDVGQIQVIDYDTRTVEGRTFLLAPEDGRVVKQFQNMSAAQAYIEQDGSAQIGGLPGVPSQELEALEHYRLVHASETVSPPQALGQRYPWVKTFERVPGATVEGEGPANTTVTASVQMRMPNTNQTFVYRQHAETGSDGEFTMTLPYSTTGYDAWGTQEGYTNVSVRAASAYQFTTSPSITTDGDLVRYTATSDVAEGNVIGENETAIQVSMEQQTLASQDSNTTDTTDSTNSTDTSGDSSTTDGNTSSSLTAPSYAARAR